MPRRDIVVIGASAGGIEALGGLVRHFPADLGAAVLVVLHLAPEHKSVLPHILSSAGPMPARHAHNGETLVPNRIYVARPDHHLLLHESHIRVIRGPRENGHRPAIDPLFRSAADVFEHRAAGVVLSGTLDDGTVGLHCIKEAGGATLAQDPDDALYPAMPANAIAYARPDYVLPVEELVDKLVRLTAASAGVEGKELPVIDDAPAPSAEVAQQGEIAPFSCPECGGTLWERMEGATASYRCRVGHAYTMNSLVAKHVESVERTLWSAYRALEERSAMSRRVARRLTDRGRTESAARFERQADAAGLHADELKALLDSFDAAAPDIEIEAVAQQQR
jgi:two-component system, chemotaxis family, protein-glutamate methylesterase/glutaminase